MKITDLHLKETYPFLDREGADPVLRLYLPYNLAEMKREGQRRPAIVLCPGGGYRFLSEREDEPVALRLTAEGYNVAVLHYSVSGFRYPTQLLELAAAMDLLVRRQEEWNADPDRIAVMGFSAGGHLAAHYSAAYASEAVRRCFPESRAPRASVLSYPVITADPAFTHKGSIFELLGHEPSEEEIALLSCDRLVGEGTPPAFLWHTAEDKSVPVENSLFYAAALSRFRIPFELHVYPYGWHGLATADGETNAPLPEKVAHAADWMPALKRWLKLVFSL
ncbi:MAG: alpha/beta hydrolase [Clostridia bacterium]|nr:alpha/beta hydrolase [Clostridia bacterium]